ncbi:MAG: hypothetical protein KAQ92_03475 [Candidatus Aenigmarchaeota archaeon]|nr:hypothetical protein [Candidatus Aenigmarchaeota archaeon]
MTKEIQKKKKEDASDKAIFEKKYKPEEAIKLAKEHNGGKKFNQTIDVCITVKQMDFKKQENKIKETIQLDNNAGLRKIVFVIGKNLSISAKDTADEVFGEKQYSDLEKDKKKIKKFSKSYDYLIAEPEYMLRIAKSMGRVLGPLGKMPTPLIPTIDPKPVIAKLKNSVIILSNQNNAIQFAIGKEKADDKILIDNYRTIMNVLKNKFPHGTQNIKNIYLKTTMGKKIQLDSKFN